MRRFPWLLTVCTALALAVLVSLGVWQVRRMAWKEGLIARAEAAAALPPTPILQALSADEPEFRRVVLDCPGLGSAPFLELRSIAEGGRPGVRLISACSLADGRAILVDRGFVADTVSARPPQQGAGGAPLRVEGVLRRTTAMRAFSAPTSGRLFYARADDEMARTLGVTRPLVPLTVYATTSANPDWTALEPSAPPPAFSNNHLGYAATWFGLAVALAGVYIALLRRSLGAAVRGRPAKDAP